MLVGRVRNVKEVEQRLRHRLLPRNAWRLIPFFELLMSSPSPKDELDQVGCWYMYDLIMYHYIIDISEAVIKITYSLKLHM
jgi:hypothetical protein